MNDQELKHYGVLGMRWGVRKRRVSTSSSRKSSTSSGTTQRRMSNKELKARINRLKLEQEYAKLTEIPQPKSTPKIEKLVKTAGNIAQLSSSAATIYKNLNDLGVVSKPRSS
jgi:hypothetical protein|nr:MAG TPA: hypothetical protein [Caudoviricetes sp.]